MVPVGAEHPSTAPRPDSYRVKSGDTLAAVSGRFCGTPGDYLSLAAASKIDNPDLIIPGETIRLACHAAYKAFFAALAPPAPLAHTQTVDTTSAAPVQQASQPPQPVVTGLSGTLSFSGLEALWVAAGGPAGVEWDAATIAECESGGDQYAENPSGASGYWQILGSVVPGDVFDPMVNAENAVTKYHDSGDNFSAWVCQS